MSIIEPTLNAKSFEERVEEVHGRPKEDAGTQAATRIRLRQAALMAKKAIKRTVVLCIIASVLALAVLGYYGYTTRVTGYLIDERQCRTMIGDTELTGTRLYGYPYQEYFGYRFIDTKVIDEKTKVNMAGNAVQIVGLAGDEFWAISVGPGEFDRKPLKAADSYVFTIGKNVAVVKYKSFCK